MALKEVYHTVASTLPINADSFGSTIPSGRVVTLDANFLVELPGVAGDWPIGVAGDTKAQAFSTTVRNPESSALVTGAHQTVAGGSTRWTQNRVADNYNETIASAEMTVYHGAGEFWTDQYAAVNDATGAALNWAAASPLYNTYGNNANNQAGQWDPGNAATQVSGLLLGDPQALPSGVPGTDVQGSISFGTFIHLRLWH